MKIDTIEIEMLPLKSIIDVGRAECLRVGSADAEHFEHRDHDGKLVDVAIAEADSALPANGLCPASRAPQLCRGQ